MGTWMRRLPPVGRTLLFVCVMITLNALLLLLAGGLAAFGHPALLEAADRPRSLLWPSIDLMRDVLPIAVTVDAAIALGSRPAV